MPEARATAASPADRAWARKQRRKLVVLALGAVGLAAALTASAFVAPNHLVAATPTYTPTDPARVLAHVPPHDPEEARARAELAAAPDSAVLAVELARADVRRARALQDPRYLGHAQATLARWWSSAEPSPGVLQVRADVEAELHAYAAARTDLDRLVALRPDDAQAHLTRARVAALTADYAAARDSCAAVARVAPALVAATCVAPLDGLAHPAEAYATLAALVDAHGDADAGLRGWMLATLGELARQRGDDAEAARRFAAALALDADDAGARGELADVELATGHVAEASRLLAGREAVDALLVLRAIAERAAHGADAAKLAVMMRDRIAAEEERGDRTHLREDARFVLAIEDDAAGAVEIARTSWVTQKALADARVLAEAAAAAHDAEAAAPVRAWRLANHVVDAQLDRALDGGGATAR